MPYWLLKSEPTTYSLADLEAEPDRTTCWEGVRNYQARNMMRDQMKVGDRAFFYHSGCETPAIVGVVEIVREGYPDDTQWDPASRYHDPKASREAPRWFMVDVRFVEALPRPVTLAELKARADELEGFPLIRRGNRLSVMPVAPEHWERIIALAGRPAGAG